MKTETVRLLESIPEIKKVTTNYPSTWNAFPTAIYRTARKPHVADLDKNELQSEWTINVELYGNSGSLTDLANAITQKFNSVGFIGSSKDANTADLKRVLLDFTGIIDNVTKQVYQK